MRPQPSRSFTGIAALLLAAAALIVLGFASTAAAVTGPNPDLQAACGTTVILVLDESGSIQSTAGAEAAVRSAASAFAAGLADTGSQLAVIEFGSAAKRVFGYTNVTSGAGGTLATTFQPYFDGTAAPPADVYDSPSQLGQWTNWEDALDEVGVLNTQSGVAPLVVIITDGDPTAINTVDGVQTNVASATAVAPAIVQANAVKAQGSHILAVGVGTSLNNATSLSRLNAISGRDVATSAAAVDLATTDVLRITDFSTLPAALRSLVVQLCQSSVTINKQVDEGQGYVPGGAGWTFGADVSPAAGSYTWITPQPGAAGPRSAATGADSAVTFQWKPSQATTSTITLAESDMSGYRLVGVSCMKTAAGSQTPEALTVTRSGPAFTAAVGSIDIVTCTVKNARMHPALSITKSVDTPTAAAGALVTWTVTVTNTGDVPLTNVAVTDPSAPVCDRVIGQLGAGQSTGYTCTATVNSTTTNVATVTGDDPLGNPVPPASSSATVTVDATIAGVPQATLRIDKRGPTTAKSGAVITYVIKITNTGAVTAENVVMRDKIPASMSIARTTPGVKVVKGQIVIEVGSLAPGVSETTRLQLRIDRRASGVRTNTATASASNAQTVRDGTRTRIIRVSGRIVIPGVIG